MNSNLSWPELDYNEWSETLETLHMKMQIAGKIKLALNPFLNQWWNVALYINTSGIGTGVIPYKDDSKDIIFEINFDFVNHHVCVRSSDTRTKIIPLENSVAEFYSELMKALNELGISVTISTLPCEVPNPVHCNEDERKAHDRDYIERWWKVMISSQKVFEKFRSGFCGKSSPIHFFWGSFDLSGTRFNGGRCTPPMPGIIMKYAENEENFAFGFWPGNKNYPIAAYYSYMYPSNEKIPGLKINGPGFYSKELGEFILNYEDVRKSDNAEETITEFLNETYNKTTEAKGWDVKSFEGPVPEK
ncbi:MAG: hypothetical protein JST55_06375 [Bacteroidetes bacterium]|nr:hypothetical protein [Bacteroidota bacterium]